MASNPVVPVPVDADQLRSALTAYATSVLTGTTAEAEASVGALRTITENAAETYERGLSSDYGYSAQETKSRQMYRMNVQKSKETLAGSSLSFEDQQAILGAKAIGVWLNHSEDFGTPAQRKAAQNVLKSFAYNRNNGIDETTFPKLRLNDRDASIPKGAIPKRSTIHALS